MDVLTTSLVQAGSLHGRLAIHAGSRRLSDGLPSAPSSLSVLRPMTKSTHRCSHTCRQRKPFLGCVVFRSVTQDKRHQTRGAALSYTELAMGRPAGVKADQCGLRARGPGSGAAGAIFGLPLAAVGHTGGDGGDFGHLAPAAPAAAEMESNVESGNQKTELSSSRGMLLRSAAFLDIGLVSSGAQQTAAAGFVGQDVIMCLCAVLGAFLWVRLFDELARRDVLEQKLSRKLVHISTGLLYFACWPLFSGAPEARFLCALAPAANCVRMLALGTGAVRDDAAVKAISREGDPRELLRGPLYYAVVLTFVTVCFWRNSPVGGIAVALMCGGDGIADIAGRRLGSAKLPWNAHKSWAGSIAMFLLGTPLALATVYFFCALGFYACSWPSTVARVALIALAATLVESLPITDRFDDNLTVPLTAVALGSVLFAA